MIAKARCNLEFGEAVRLCSNGDVDSMTRDKEREIWSEMSKNAVKSRVSNENWHKSQLFQGRGAR